MKPLTFTQAKASGMRRYFTGVACPRGHVAERFVSTRACVQCASEKALAWKAKNPEKAKAQKRAWCDANPDRMKMIKSAEQKRNRASANARSRRWYAAHSEQAKAATSLWGKNHPDRVAAKVAQYRAAKLRQTPTWADHDAIGMIYRAAEICRVSGFDVHVDHIIPLQGDGISGFHVHRNLQLLVAAANRSKANHFSERN